MINSREIPFISLVDFNFEDEICTQEILFMILHSFLQFIIHKVEIQMVIFRCLICLSLDWYKSYDKKHKDSAYQTSFFVQDSKKKVNNCILRHNF